MFKRNKEYLFKKLINYFKENPTELWGILEDHILNDPTLIKQFEAKFDKAKANRISRELNRKIDTLEAKEIEMEGSTEPWFNYVVLGYDNIMGWKTKLAWNAAFIKKAKEAGIKGSTEEEIAERYLMYTQYEPFVDADA